MAGIGTVLIGACLGAGGTLLVQSYLAMRAARVELINDFIKDLVEIEALATDYWHEVAALSAEDPKRQTVAAKLRAKLHSARCFRRVAKKCLGTSFEKFDSLDRVLFKTATGGDFETSRAKQDLVRAHIVIESCAEIRSLLRLARRKPFLF